MLMRWGSDSVIARPPSDSARILLLAGRFARASQNSLLQTWFDRSGMKLSHSTTPPGIGAEDALYSLAGPVCDDPCLLAGQLKDN